MIGSRRHGADHLPAEGALGRQAEDRIGALHRVGERARRRVDGVGRLPLVHALAAALVDHALGIAEDDVVRPDAEPLDQLDAGDAGRAGAVADELHAGEVAAGEVDGIDQARRRDDRGAVLVVVEDRDIHQLAQPAFDDEAVGRLDVLEIDAAEGRLEIAHRVDEGVDVLGVDLEIDRIDVGEALEEDGLAFHHRLRGERAEIAEAEDGGAVGDDRDEIAARRVVEGLVRVLGDRLDRNRDPRRVGERQVALRRHRLGRRDLDLSRPPLGVEIEGLLVGDGGTGFRRSRRIVHKGFPRRRDARLPASD